MSKKTLMQRVFKGHVQECADDLGISPTRLYELIGPDDPYARTWRLLSALARHNPEGLRMIADDFQARVEGILQSTSAAIDVNRLVDAIIDETVPERERRRVVDALVDLQRTLETR